MISNNIKVKRPVTIKTVITDEFKTHAAEELNKELHLLETQLLQLELQNKQIQDQVNNFGAFNGDEAKQI